jgi:hypothetical protein
MIPLFFISTNLHAGNGGAGGDGTSLACLTVPVLFANSNETNAIEKQDSQMRHGKNGQNGENGEDGQNGGNGGNGGKEENSSTNAATKQSSEQVDEWEYKILKDICRQLISITISKFYDPFDSVCLVACKQSVSNYLLQVGTSAAKKIWQEYENVKWSYPAIVNI